MLETYKMSTRERLERIQKELAEIGVAFLPIVNKRPADVTPDFIAEKNPYFEEVTDATPILYTCHGGLWREHSYDENGDMLVKDCFEERVTHLIGLTHENMWEGGLWEKTCAVFCKYNLALDPPVNDEFIADLYI